MKQTIEIEVPEGKQAIWKDGKIIFEDIAPKLPESWEEFCELHPIKEEEVFIDSDSLITKAKKNQRLYRSYRNILPSAKAASAHLALIQLHQLRDCYRQGWTPNWKDNNSDKYCVALSENEYGVYKYSQIRRFLSFQSKEIAEKFFKNFKDLIEKAGDLI